MNLQENIESLDKISVTYRTTLMHAMNALATIAELGDDQSKRIANLAMDRINDRLAQAIAE